MKINPENYQVLIVDDIAPNVILLRAILKKQKYNIISASSGEEALEIISKENPDIVLLDVMMPGLSGFDVCNHVRNKMGNEDLPIILLTALNSSDDIVEGFKVGASDFVSKPFNNAVLLQRLQFQLSVVASKRIIKKQAETLAKTMKSRDQLYSVIAHDLRSPLATIKMIMNYLVIRIKDYKVDEDIVEMLNTVNSVSEEGFDLFDNLLKWTKSQVGSLKPVLKEYNAIDVTETSLEMLKKIAENKSIALNIEKPEGNYNILVDIDMLKTIFRNLVYNAIKFSEENSTITVKIIPEENNIRFSVIDEGKGMNEKLIEKVEEGTVDFSTPGTNNEKGSGLGLLLTRDFIIKNGGKLEVKSILGKGSSFSFILPQHI
ncbi:MAG: hybrid sensor histidine kinase/response regulator [Bacteroidales bacterium]